MLMAYEIKTAGVAFNLKNPEEAALYKHLVSRGNQSAYIKRLIYLDMKGVWATEKLQAPIIAEKVDESLMANLI